tara:strand:- start:1194 stop:1793 length:600 start_codon:yes stop_codon:yes gene_type:complete
MTKIPDQIIYRNEWGVLQLGPVGEKDKVGEDASTNLFNALKNGYTEIQTLTGNKEERVPGSSHEICGSGLNQDSSFIGPSENIAKSIVCKNGDLVLAAPDGNVKIIAKNIYVETIGSDSDGSILIKANDHITMRAEEQLNLAGGKVCVTSADSITLNAKGYLRLLYADVIQGSPLSGLLGSFLPGPVASLITDIAETCK